jgi:hypothetical protein
MLRSRRIRQLFARTWGGSRYGGNIAPTRSTDLMRAMQPLRRMDAIFSGSLREEEIP